MDREPDFHAFLEQEFGAVIVGAPYGAMPETYARTIYDGDALRVRGSDKGHRHDHRGEDPRCCPRQRLFALLGTKRRQECRIPALHDFPLF